MPSEPFITDHEVAEAMLSHGGGFVESLARTWFRADAGNKAKLEAAFPEVWADYREIAVLAKRHQDVRNGSDT